jgi:hypothetical protein
VLDEKILFLGNEVQAGSRIHARLSDVQLEGLGTGISGQERAQREHYAEDKSNHDVSSV